MGGSKKKSKQNFPTMNNSISEYKLMFFDT